MLTQLVRRQSPEEAELLSKRDDLTSLRAALAERELQLADLRTHLKSFEGRYLRQAGVLYAELDDLEARIAEREVALYDTDTARARATAARQQADATHEAAFGEAREAEDFEPSPDLKRLFRDIAKRIHPDFARSPADHEHCTRLMARANKAYARGDLEALERILDDFHETTVSPNEDSAAELQRIARQIEQARRDIALIDEEMSILPTSEIAQFQQEYEAAHNEGRDLLAELAVNLNQRIADAQYRLQFLERQIFAHGR
jgi:hypothetical protein